VYSTAYENLLGKGRLIGSQGLTNDQHQAILLLSVLIPPTLRQETSSGCPCASSLIRLWGITQGTGAFLLVSFMQVSEEDKDLLKLSINYSNSGYAMVRTSEVAGEWSQNQEYIHRIVVRRMLRVLLPPSHLFVVDHINNDKLDNRRENLRLLTQSENTARTKTPKQNRYGYARIQIIYGGRFGVLFKINCQTNHFGSYDTAEEAAFWADVWVYRTRGPETKLNFPERIDEIKAEALKLVTNFPWKRSI